MTTATTGRERQRFTPRGFSLVMVSIVSVQFGSAIAKHGIPVAGPIGMVFYRIAFSAVMLYAVSRPQIRGRPAGDWRLILTYGLAMAGMNTCFYAALQYLPVGVAVTIEFTGPLAVAIFASRRLVDAFWALLAAAGLVLLSPISGVELDGRGVLLALGAGAFWAMYILVSSRVGERVPGLSGLALALLVGSVALAVPAVSTAGSALLEPKVIGIGLVIAVMSSAVPYACELEALRSLSRASFGMLMSLEPAFAALAGAVVLGEHLGGAELLAIALVLVANAGAVLTRPPDHQPELGNLAP